jgi:hypothetical protein
MKTYPIIFSPPMVRSLIAGQKTQTRRLPTSVWANLKMHHEMGTPCALWMRETWAMASRAVDLSKIYYKSHERASHSEFHEFVPTPLVGIHQPTWPRFKPSIHMPRWASRLTLEVNQVRLVRLQDITEEDAIAEGATARPSCHGFGNQYPGWSMDWSNVGQKSRWADGGVLTERDVCLGSARHAFGGFINQLHGGRNWNCKPEPSLWDQNPEVYAISFVVHRQHIDQFIGGGA